MNGLHILNWLLEDSERNATEFYNGAFPYNSNAELEDMLLELNSRRHLLLSKAFYDTIKKSSKNHNSRNHHNDNKINSYVKEVFKNNITMISLVLNYIYPERYFFYRRSMLENEIFAGFKFLSDIIEDFNLPFSSIGEGKHSYDNYTQLNDALHSFANKAWPDLKDPKIIQQRIHYFIYQGLGSLFLNRNDYNQYWIMATGEPNFEELDTKIEVNWSGRKEMQQGDLVFMYRQTPRKAITELFSVSQSPWFDPYGGWTGFWVPLSKITSISDITMVDMKHDEKLKHWGFVKVSSQGVSTAPMPYFAYNRLLELIGNDVSKKYDLKPEITGDVAIPNEYSTEIEFEDEVIEPLLKRWGFKHQRQFPCEFIVGSQRHSCQIDFVVKDSDNNPLTLFENKIRIANEKELTKAVLQAKSYALQLGLGNFVVASPEGFWIYKLDRNREIPVAKITADKVEELKSFMSKTKLPDKISFLG